MVWSLTFCLISALQSGHPATRVFSHFQQQQTWPHGKNRISHCWRVRKQDKINFNSTTKSSSSNEIYSELNCKRFKIITEGKISITSKQAVAPKQYLKNNAKATLEEQKFPPDAETGVQILAISCRAKLAWELHLLKTLS